MSSKLHVSVIDTTISSTHVMYREAFQGLIRKRGTATTTKPMRNGFDT